MRMNDMKDSAKPMRTPQLPLLLLVLALIQPNLAGATESVCLRLFAQPTTRNSQAITPTLSTSLTEASREYLARLEVLVNQRHLLSPEVLQKIIDSPRPLNPLGDKPANITLFPHQTAFQHLLQDGLQWELIQQATRAMAGLAQQEQARTEEAVRETAELPAPHLIKEFPFSIDHIVRTDTGKLLGVATTVDRKDRSTTIRTYELPSGVEGPTQKINSLITDLYQSAKVAGNTALFSLIDSQTSQVLSFDLLNGKKLSEPSLQRPSSDKSSSSEATGPKQVYLVEKNNRIGVVTFVGDDIILIDPFTGQDIYRQTIKGLPKEKEQSGLYGSSLFVSENLSPTFLIDPWGENFYRKLLDLTAISTFTYHGETYALGMDLLSSSTYDFTHLKTVNLSTGDVSPTFQVNRFGDAPRLIETFEENGVLYGFITTNEDALVVDLLKGAIVQKLSQSPFAENLGMKWSRASAGQVGFTFKGKFYLLAIQHEENERSKGQLVVIDPMTLQPVFAGLVLNDSVTSIKMIQKEGNDAAVVLNYLNGTSQLVGLIGSDN